MTKVIIKPDDKEEIILLTHLPPEEIERLIKELEEERLYQKALKN